MVNKIPYSARWILIPVGLVLAIILSLMITLWIQSITGIMYEFYMAILLPTVAIQLAIYLAPRFKEWVGVLTFIIGLWLAYTLAYPVWYGEWHPKAYQPTYIPFYMVCIVGLMNVMGFFGWRHHIKSSNSN